MKKKVLFISSIGGRLDELMYLAFLFEKYGYTIGLTPSRLGVNIDNSKMNKKA